jgi:DNA segregation ATPase FtsK/SpoIIIE, S-DNA-T family
MKGRVKGMITLAALAYGTVGVMAVLPFLPNPKGSHKGAIKTIFRRNGYMQEKTKMYPIGELYTAYPQYEGCIRSEKYVKYIYKTPLGKSVNQTLIQAVTEGFACPATITSEEGKTIVTVYHSNIPKLLQYESEQMEGWGVKFGSSLEGDLYHDFDQIPHISIAGATRQGKTVMLKNVFTALCEQKGADAQFTIIDLKGGLEFWKLRNHINVKGIATDVYEANATLKRIRTEINKEMQRFRANDYNNIVNTNEKKRKFIIIDEAAELAPDRSDDKDTKLLKQECQAIMSQISRIAGALGYRLIFCTQYPIASTFPGPIKQNMVAKISFRLPTEIASRVAIDKGGAERLPHPGRGIYQTHETTHFQAPILSDKEMMERLEHLKGEKKDEPAPLDKETEDGIGSVDFE